MDQNRQRWLVAKITEITEEIRKIDGFMGEHDLKSAYMILHTATAAVMFDELPSLAQRCADWCGEMGDKVVMSN